MDKFDAATPFQLVAGHPALDFVNTLDDRFLPAGPVELLKTYEDLLRFTHQSGLLSDSRLRKLRRAGSPESAAAEVLAEAKALRENLAQAAYSILDGKQIPAEAVQALELTFKQFAVERRLAADTVGLAWTWKGLGRQVAAPLWLLAESAESLFVSDQLTHLRCCDCDTCRWLFLDTSKNHTRRWCDMKVCGNRMKARRFLSRQAAAAAKS